MIYTPIYRSKQDEDKIQNEIATCKYKCPKCGHVVIINKQNKALCIYCGIWVFKNQKEEFKYRLAEKIGKKV